MFVGRMTQLIKRYCSLIGRRETECAADWHLTALLLIFRRCRPPMPQPPAVERFVQRFDTELLQPNIGSLNYLKIKIFTLYLNLNLCFLFWF